GCRRRVFDPCALLLLRQSAFHAAAPLFRVRPDLVARRSAGVVVHSSCFSGHVGRNTDSLRGQSAWRPVFSGSLILPVRGEKCKSGAPTGGFDRVSNGTELGTHPGGRYGP